jgi:hypothetical protein
MRTAATATNERLRSEHRTIGMSPEISPVFPARRGYHAAAASANVEKEPVFVAARLKATEHRIRTVLGCAAG